MSTLTKVAKVIRDPSLIIGRVNSFLTEREKARMDLAHERERLLAFLAQHFDGDPGRIRDEYLTGGFKARYEARKAELSKLIGDLRHTTSDFDLESIYMLVRLLKPRVVVETGVFHGGSTAHVLEAMRLNGHGELHSIDLPHERNKLGRSGFLVGDRRPDNWELILGDSKDELPALLERLGRIDMFHHVCLHTFDHMTWEYNQAVDHVNAGGVVSSHDVVDAMSRKNAFEQFCQAQGFQFGIFRNLGIAPVAR
jgi:predicted O-methyltransferase YrrM